MPKLALSMIVRDASGTLGPCLKSAKDVVDEMVVHFTHSIWMDWLLPGVSPTGKSVELAVIVVVQLEGDKVEHEHVYWDHASLLAQIGLLDNSRLPVVGAEGARSVVDRNLPLNLLVGRARRA